MKPLYIQKYKFYVFVILFSPTLLLYILIFLKHKYKYFVQEYDKFDLGFYFERSLPFLRAGTAPWTISQYVVFLLAFPLLTFFYIPTYSFMVEQNYLIILTFCSSVSVTVPL